MNYRRVLLPILGLTILAAMACAGATTTPAAAPTASTQESQQEPAPTSTSIPQPSPQPTATSEPNTTTSLPLSGGGPTQTTPMPVENTPTPAATQGGDREQEERIFSILENMGWKTDFSKTSVSILEIMSGGPPRDGIPPIDNPEYASVSEPPEYMSDAEPVIAVEIEGDARAYPLAILIWHEIVNGEVGGVPITVTYCPLCNTAITFDRRVGDQVLDFGTSGLLRNSDLVMWDRQTETWWQQITGEAIVGELTGTKLTFIPAPLVSWSEFVEAFPEGQVLTRNTGFSRNYNRAPYSGYDDLSNEPFLFRGDIDERLPSMERVIGLTVDEKSVAYPFMLLEENPVIHDAVEGQDLVIFFTDGTESAFAGFGYSESRIVGSTGVYEPVIDGEKLAFSIQNGAITDEQTGSQWNILGQAISGELQGKQLPSVVHANHFWFAWQAFNADTEVRTQADISG